MPQHAMLLVIIADVSLKSKAPKILAMTTHASMLPQPLLVYDRHLNFS